MTFDHPSTGIVRKPAIILQRTTNSKQPRRLIAAVIPRKIVKKYRGYVSENHTILLIPSAGRAALKLLCKLLNSNAVDRRYRRVGGTASISIGSLRNLPPPRSATPVYRDGQDRQFRGSNRTRLRFVGCVFHDPIEGRGVKNHRKFSSPVRSLDPRERQEQQREQASRARALLASKKRCLMNHRFSFGQVSQPPPALNSPSGRIRLTGCLRTLAAP